MRQNDQKARDVSTGESTDKFNDKSKIMSFSLTPISVHYLGCVILPRKFVIPRLPDQSSYQFR